MNEELLQLLQSGFASGYSEDRIFAMAIDQGFSYNDVTLALESFSKKRPNSTSSPGYRHYGFWIGRHWVGLIVRAKD